MVGVAEAVPTIRIMKPIIRILKSFIVPLTLDYVIVIENALRVVPDGEPGDADKVTVAKAKAPGARTFPLVHDPLVQTKNETEIESWFGGGEGLVFKWSVSLPVPTFSMQMYCV